MCGICGIINHDHANPVDAGTLERMKAVITHRGPDDHGTHIDGGAGLGFRRLSIIDLKLGHQPMSNEDGSVWVVFNGEIYNHEDIRGELIARGHQYKTRCDTETIIHLYEEEGINAFSRLNGMFALAIWDGRKKRAILVRDRLGIKPLYYVQNGGRLIFGSEIKTILEAAPDCREVNVDCVPEYLTFRYPAGEQTMFRDIRCLLPGHILTLQDGRTTIEKFWDLPDPQDTFSVKENTLMEQLDELLNNSVKLRLMSDVPLGSFCSGGVDSGLTTAYATKHGKLGIDTFSVGFDEADFDESLFAKMVSDRYQTRHHTLTINNRKFADSLPKIIWYYDEPLNHANSVPIHHIAKLARQFVTVVLTGEGSDELFAGYPRYNIAKIYSKAMAVPRFGRALFKKAVDLTSMRRVRKLGYFMPMSPSEVAVYNASFVERPFVRDLLPESAVNSALEYRYSFTHNPEIGRRDLLTRLWRLDMKTYLVSLLHRMDKMTMAASIEARVPFLDHRVVEWGLRVPPTLKINGFTNKYLVKKLGVTLLPREVIFRGKSGFGVPIGRWARDDKLLGRYLKLFAEPEFTNRDYLNVGRVRQVVSEHLEGKTDHGEVLWNLINLELWHRIFIDRQNHWVDEAVV